jgi:hypothetical protein
MGRTADQLGFDTMWLTEHHFQYEGYEVLPNLIQFGQHLAMQTQDFAWGRCSMSCRNGIRCGSPRTSRSPTSSPAVGWSSVSAEAPCREAWALGTVVASGDNEMSAEHDRINREIFEESMEVIKLAWYRSSSAIAASIWCCRPTMCPIEAHGQRSHADPQALAPRRHLPAGHVA